ncbi:hypothetical protein HanIR_Chr04g0184891 [Helianthus annuus]|nr:hypothetical protein HanIR_Chr04g0184891 [Helianthus annuus]
MLPLCLNLYIILFSEIYILEMEICQLIKVFHFFTTVCNNIHKQGTLSRDSKKMEIPKQQHTLHNYAIIKLTSSIPV